jgi:hypothetical protein
MPIDPNTPVGEAREHIMEQAREDGIKCPCCDQLAKVYRRQIYSTMVRQIIKLYRAGAATRYVHVPTVIGYNGGDVCKLRYWGLIEEQDETRTDGGRAGNWRLTELGVAWIKGEVTVPKYALIYDGRCLALEGDPVNIQNSLGKKFNYYELMAGE